MISMDKQYRTRDGREVRIYAVDGGGYYPIHGAYKDSMWLWVQNSWVENGVCNYDNDLDLIEVKPRIQREEWVNVYPTFTSRSHQTREIAERLAEDGRIACIKRAIDCEEGEGL